MFTTVDTRYRKSTMECTGTVQYADENDTPVDMLEFGSGLTIPDVLAAVYDKVLYTEFDDKGYGRAVCEDGAFIVVIENLRPGEMATHSAEIPAIDTYIDGLNESGELEACAYEEVPSLHYGDDSWLASDQAGFIRSDRVMTAREAGQSGDWGGFFMDMIERDEFINSDLIPED